MKETTQIYIVIKSTLGMYSGNQKVVGAYLSLREAEYEVWKLTSGMRKEWEMSFAHNYTHFLVEKVDVKNNPLEHKDYAKFLEEKRKEIKEQIASKEKCENKDKEDILKLTKELELYY